MESKHRPFKVGDEVVPIDLQSPWYLYHLKYRPDITTFTVVKVEGEDIWFNSASSSGNVDDLGLLKSNKLLLAEPDYNSIEAQDFS